MCKPRCLWALNAKVSGFNPTGDSSIYTVGTLCWGAVLNKSVLCGSNDGVPYANEGAQTYRFLHKFETDLSELWTSKLKCVCACVCGIKKNKKGTGRMLQKIEPKSPQCVCLCIS